MTLLSPDLALPRFCGQRLKNHTATGHEASYAAGLR